MNSSCLLRPYHQPSAALLKALDHITSGFEIVPAVLDRHEFADVAAALQEEGLERSRAGARHLTRHPVVQQLAHDPRLLALAGRFLGPSVIPFRATLGTYTGTVPDAELRTITPENRDIRAMVDPR